MAAFAAAAFRRLCVETPILMWNSLPKYQPPSGGCVLKRTSSRRLTLSQNQPPSGGCVLKLHRRPSRPYSRPSRLQAAVCLNKGIFKPLNRLAHQPPSGGCVLKPQDPIRDVLAASAAFRRLCVETKKTGLATVGGSSRLQAAVC